MGGTKPDKLEWAIPALPRVSFKETPKMIPGAVH